MPTAKFVADFSDFATGAATTDVKLAAFGASVDKAGVKVGELALATEKGVGPFNSLKGSLSQFDSALGAMGISIGPEIRALGEFGDVAGKTTKDVGLLGTAGLVTAAALGGWKIGRMVAEFFGLDDAIANTTARLLGWGDVAAEVAGSKADVLAKATKNAGHAITDYSEAIAINVAAQNRWAGTVTTANATATEAAKARAAFLKEGMAAEAAQAQHLADLHAKLFGQDLTARAREYVAVIGPLSELSKISATEQANINKLMGEAIEVYTRFGQVAPAAMRDLWTATQAGIPVVTGLGNLFKGFETIAVGALQPVAEATIDMGETWEQTRDRINAAQQTIPPVAAAAANSMQMSYAGAFTAIVQSAEQKFAQMAQTAKYYSDLAGAGIIQMNPTGLSRPTGHLQSFAQGGSGDFGSGTPVMLHGKETIVPFGAGGGGGTVVHVGGINIVVGAGGDGAQAGRAAADALLAQLQARGVRV